VKELSKLINIWRSYGQRYGGMVHGVNRGYMQCCKNILNAGCDHGLYLICIQLCYFLQRLANVKRKLKLELNSMRIAYHVLLVLFLSYLRCSLAKPML